MSSVRRHFLFPLICSSFLLFSAVPAHAATNFVDGATGSDANAGAVTNVSVSDDSYAAITDAGFDAAVNSYVLYATKVADGVLAVSISPPRPVVLGGKVHKVTTACMLQCSVPEEERLDLTQYPKEFVEF